MPIPMRNAHGYHHLVCDEHCSEWFHRPDAQADGSGEERCNYESWFWSQMPDGDPHLTGSPVGRRRLRGRRCQTPMRERELLWQYLVRLRAMQPLPLMQPPTCRILFASWDGLLYIAEVRYGRFRFLYLNSEYRRTKLSR